MNAAEESERFEFSIPGGGKWFPSLRNAHKASRFIFKKVFLIFFIILFVSFATGETSGE